MGLPLFDRELLEKIFLKILKALEHQLCIMFPIRFYIVDVNMFKIYLRMSPAAIFW